MKYFMDSEFIDDGRTIDLVSIGIVAEDGREYYAQSAEFLEHGKPTPWIQKHVIPHLGTEWTERATIRDDILAFMDIGKYGTPELWGWCAGYDFVVFCQLFGTMLDLPEGYPHYIHDIQQLLDERAIPDSELPLLEGEIHHALDDARYLQRLWNVLHSS